MNRIFKISSLVAVALMAMCGCTDDLYLSPEAVSGGSDSSVPFGVMSFRTGSGTRGQEVTTENISSLEATAYTDIEKNEFKFEKYLFNNKTGDGTLVCDKNPQWPGVHRYRKPDADGSYPEGTPADQIIPEKYADWELYPFDEAADTNYANYYEPQEGIEVKIEDVPTGYVYLEHYKDPDWIYIIDYDEPSTLNLFVYSPPLQQLREAFNSGTPGKPGATGIMYTAPNGIYDFFNTYVGGVGLKPAENFNANTELKIYYRDGVAKPGYKLGMFHVAQDISRQVDFVTANMTPKARKINEGDEDGIKVYELEPIPVDFKHHLCNIEIKAKNSCADYDIDVAGVMIGRAMIYGPMFNFSTDEWEYPPLDRQDLYNVVSYPFSPANAKHTVGDYIHRLGDTPVSLMGNGGNAFVLPINLKAWTYSDPDNQDAFLFHGGERPIMYMGALIQVTTKGEDPTEVEMLYPLGSIMKGYDVKDTNTYWKYNETENVWLMPNDEIEYYEDYNAWYYYGGDAVYDSDSEDWVTDDDYQGYTTGFSFDSGSGLWSYNKSEDSGTIIISMLGCSIGR